MMKFRLEALEPETGSPAAFEVSEQNWRPIRSLMAIANQRIGEKADCSPVSVECMEDIDENTGTSVTASICEELAAEMKLLAGDPFTVSDYGMSVDIEDGVTYYTYPVGMCTAYLEDVENGNFFESLESPDIVGRRVRSWFRTPENTLEEAITFFEKCGGFVMP